MNDYDDAIDERVGLQQEYPGAAAPRTRTKVADGHVLVVGLHLIVFAVVYGLLAGGAKQSMFDDVSVSHTVGGIDRNDWTTGLGIAGSVALAVYASLLFALWSDIPVNWINGCTGPLATLKWTAMLYFSTGVADALALLTVLPFAGMNDLFVIISSCLIVVASNTFFGVIAHANLESGHPDSNLLIHAAVSQTVPYVLIGANLIENEGEAQDLYGADSKTMITVGVFIWISVKIVMAAVTAGWLFTNPKSRAFDSTGVSRSNLTSVQMGWIQVIRLVSGGLMLAGVVAFCVVYAFPDELDNTWSALFWVSGGKIVDSWVWPACQSMPMTAAAILALFWLSQALGIYMGWPIFGSKYQHDTGNDPVGVAAWALASGAIMVQLCSVANVNHLSEMIIYVFLIGVGVVLHGTYSPSGTNSRLEDPVALWAKALIGCSPFVFVLVKFYYGPDGAIDDVTQAYVWCVCGVYFLYFIVDSFMRLSSNEAVRNVITRMQFQTVFQFLAVLATAGFAYSDVCMSEKIANQYDTYVQLATGGLILAPK